MNELIQINKLPDDSLHIIKNHSKDKKRITSYSISIYEQEYPASNINDSDISRNSIILNIKEKNDLLLIQMKENQFKETQAVSNDIIEVRSCGDDSIQVSMRANSNDLIRFIENNVKYSLDHYSSKADTFGCCSKFIECSDAKHCVHSNQLYSRACMYRVNLEKGLIFYGKNKNI